MNQKRLVVALALAFVGTASASIPLIERIDPSEPAFTVAATDPVGGKLVVAGTAGGTLQVIDLSPAGPATRIGVGATARGLLVNAVSGFAYVIDDTAGGSVAVVDLDGSAVIARTAFGHAPAALAADFPRGELYVAHRGDASLTLVDAATLATLATVGLSGEASALAVDARRGLLFAMSTSQGTIDVIDLDYRHRIGIVAVAGTPGGATVDERSGKVYVHDRSARTVYVVDPSSLSVVGTIAAAGDAPGTMSRIHRRYYVPDTAGDALTIIDTDNDEVTSRVAVGAGPRQAVLSPTDDQVYVVNGDDASISVISARTETLVRTLRLRSRPLLALALQDRVVWAHDGASAEGLVLASTQVPADDTALATEFVDAAQRRYLHSASSSEVRLIADGLYGSAWRRTMRFHRVWTQAAEGRVPVCQFSRVGDAEPGRVFAVAAAECDALGADPSLVAAGTAYYVAPPGDAGKCPGNTEPLYRLSQRRSDGSIGQRFVRDAGVRDTLQDAGWIADGAGKPAAFACVPMLQQGAAVEVGLGEPAPARPFPRPAPIRRGR